jgi:hypothetical protein
MNLRHYLNKHLPAIIGCLLALTGTPALAQNDFTSREHGPSQAQLVDRGSTVFPGLSFFRPVLSGVLYRAGFNGGDKSRSGLSPVQRDELCNAGFSSAFYVDFGTHTRFDPTDCGNNQLSYYKASSTSTHDVMKVIHDIIKTPNKGPALVHCMWGVHASGATAAMALIQFCGWSEEQAKNYWNQARNNANCSGGCDKWIDSKFAQFKPDPALSITAEEQQRICPK